MNETVAGALAGLIVGLPGLWIAVLNWRQNRAAQQATQRLAQRQQRLQERRATNEDLDRSLAALRLDVERLGHDLAAERDLRREAEQRARDAEHRASEAERRAAELEARVAHLEDALEVATSAAPDCEGEQG